MYILLDCFYNLCRQGAGVQILNSLNLDFGIQVFKSTYVIPKCFVTCYKGHFILGTFSCIILRKMNTGQSDTRNAETESSILQTILTQAETSAKVSLFSSEVVFFVGINFVMLEAFL